MDFNHTCQRPNESVNEFIIEWMSLTCNAQESLSEQSAVQMCANNLDPQIAIYIGTVEPQNFDALISKTRNMERQLTHQKSAQPKREESKSLTKKGESTAIFMKTSPKPTNGGTFNKNSKGKQKDEGRQLTH